MDVMRDRDLLIENSPGNRFCTDFLLFLEFCGRIFGRDIWIYMKERI